MPFLFGTLLGNVGVATVFLITTIYFYFKSSFQYWKKLKVPHVQPQFPIGNIGEVIFLRKSLRTVFKEHYDQLEGERFGGTYLFAIPGLFFRDPDLIKNVLVKDFSSFHDRGFYCRDDVEPLCGHLFVLPGSRWRNIRTKLTPTFTSGKMKMMFQNILDCCQDLENVLSESVGNEDQIDVKDISARYTTDVISSCAFGIECNSLKNPDAEFREWGRKFITPSFRAAMSEIIFYLYPKLSSLLRIPSIDPEISAYFRKMIKDIVDYREKSNFVRSDFMQLLIQIKNKGKVDKDEEDCAQNRTREVENGSVSTMNDPTTAEDRLTMDALTAQAFVFFTAGFETSSTTMTFCLYELALNPDIQDLTRQDIDTVLSRHGGRLTYEAVEDMQYLDRVVAETLRKYPPLPMLNRECTRDYKIPGTDVVIKKGMKVVIPVHALHHDPQYYPDPEKFDPERFTEEQKRRRPHHVYLPFGEGPRVCIGMRFGLMQTKVGLITLLSKYEFSVCPKTPIPLVVNEMSFTITPVGGMWLKIKKRSADLRETQSCKT